MYGTLTGWRDYATARGNSAPSNASDTLATQALTRASDMIEHTYVANFSSRYTKDSPNVEPATYEAALLELATPGFFSATHTPSQMKVLTEAKGVKWTSKDDDSPIERDASMKVSTVVYALMKPYMVRKKSVLMRSLGK